MFKKYTAYDAALTFRDALIAFVGFGLVAFTLLSNTSAPAGPIRMDLAALAPDLSAITTPSRYIAPQTAALAVKAAVPMLSNGLDASFQRTTPATAIFLLAAIFSAAIAFTLAMLRHLRRVHAVPRRQTWAHR